MLHLINGKILLSGATIIAAAALVIGGTFAFFSDSETSTGNTFTAGSLDLKVDSECHYFQNGIDGTCGQGASFGNWTEDDLDLGVHKFFNFDDVKPGDWGEDTISLHVLDNDAWGQFVIGSLDDTGTLRENMEFWVWLDQGIHDGFQCSDGAEIARCSDDPQEGDNIWQSSTEPLIITPGPVDTDGEIWNIWDGLLAARVFNGNTDSNGITSDGRIVGSITYYLGLGWCFGEANLSQPSNAVCDGSGVGNEVQGDILTGDISINVVQQRNNPTQDGIPTPTP